MELIYSLQYNMKDFNKAKQIIEEYRKLRLFPEKKNAFDLHKKLAEVGYTDIEFTNDKMIEELNNKNFNKIFNKVKKESIKTVNSILK